MKRTVAYLVILVLLIGLAACGGRDETGGDPSGSPSGSSARTEGGQVLIGGKTLKLTYESRHGDMYFKENVVDIEKSSFGQACNLYCNSDEGMLFVIHIVYFEGKSIEEVMSGSENTLTDKTVGNIEYRYFEYDENGAPGHTYAYCFEGTTYTVSFVSNYDMTSLESVFLSNVRFEKES